MRKCTLIFSILLLSQFGLSFQTPNPSPVFDEFLKKARVEYFYPLMESGVQLTQSMRAKILGYAMKEYYNELGSTPNAVARLNEIRQLLLKYIRAVPSEQPLWPIIEAAEDGTYDMEMRTLFSPSSDQIKTRKKDTPPAYIPSLNASINSLRFYEGGQSSPPAKERVYGTLFNRATTRYVWWELSLLHPAPGQRRDFSIRQIWMRGDRSVLANQEMETFILDTWLHSEHCHSWGSSRIPNWQPGRYMLELYIDGKMIARGSFQIY